MGYYQDLDDDRYADVEAAHHERAFEASKVSTIEYSIAKRAAVGSRTVCGACGRPFVKRSYQQAFCRNKGRGNCKDRYWNAVSPRGLGRFST
jgi:hypothetical protein